MAKLTDQEKIIDVLEKILKVLGLQVASEKSITERVYLLRLAGLDNDTIAQILNTTPATVRALGSRGSKKK